MHAIYALSLAHALELLRRPATLVLALVGALLILSLRWFSAFGLGYEVVQLQELAVYTIGLMGAIAVILFWLPGDDDSGEAAMLTRPVSPWMLVLTAFTGRLAVLLLLVLWWVVCLWLALVWFRYGSPGMYGYRGADAPLSEAFKALGPVAGQVLATAMLLALVQPVARFRRPVAVVMAALALYVLGFVAAGQGGWFALLLPDLNRHDLTGALWGMPGIGLTFFHVLHACAWSAIGLAVDQGILSRRLVS